MSTSHPRWGQLATTTQPIHALGPWAVRIGIHTMEYSPLWCPHGHVGRHLPAGKGRRDPECPRAMFGAYGQPLPISNISNTHVDLLAPNMRSIENIELYIYLKCVPSPLIPITCYMNTQPNNLFCKAPLGWFRKAANSALIEDSYRLHLCPIWAHCASNIMVPVCAYTGSYSSPHKGLVHVHGTGPHMWPIVGDC